MNILHVEDHPLFSDGLGQLLTQRFPNVVLKKVSNFKTLLNSLHQGIDLVLFDLYLPEMNGIKMMQELRKKAHITPVAFLSASEEIADIKQCMDQGAMGFIPKSLSGEGIVNAIMSILEGEKFLTCEHKKAIEALDTPYNAELAKQYALSYKQIEVLESISRGHSNSAVAKQMGISESAVKYHIHILFQSFDVKNRVECLRYAEKIGLITA